MKYRFILFFSLLLAGLSYGQERDVIQFSGLVLSDVEGELEPVPYTTISVKNTSRGVYSNFNGFFSIVVRKGETITFSSVGYQSVDVVIPDSLENNRYSIVQLLTQDAVNLPETVIFPWPDRDHFKLEFLALDVNDVMAERAQENLAQERLDRISASMPMDAGENADYYIRKDAQKFYHIGQTPPMPIFSPIAWAKFFKAWKNGDFKKK